MMQTATDSVPYLDPEKFQHPEITAGGAKRARVSLRHLDTLWFNTGTLCNLACKGCYIESSPTNDSLVYLSLEETIGYLDELEALQLGTKEIGFTGGEPFMNPDFLPMLEASLERGYRALVLTNAMLPMMKQAAALRALKDRFASQLVIRLSLDHHTPQLHELLRGPHSWGPTIAGLNWLSDNGFTMHVAGRTCWDESIPQLRVGYGRLFAKLGFAIDHTDPVSLVLFPEMDETLDVPEISEDCWGLLGMDPASIMCATSRMVIKRKGDAQPVVVSCTLLAYDEAFSMGHSLAAALGEVKLNHPHCARFCVLGGGACSHTGR